MKEKFEIDADYNVGSISNWDTTHIHEFVVKYDIPHIIANKLIGKTENETEENIRIVSEAIDKYAEKHKSDNNDRRHLCNTWNTNYGYAKSDNNDIVENEHEQTIIQLIVDLHNKNMTTQKICDELKNRGYKTRRGKTDWQTGMITRIIQREKEKE